MKNHFNNQEYMEETEESSMPDLSDRHLDEEARDETTSFLLQNESEMLESLLAAAKYKKDEDSACLIEIARGGKVVLAFHIRPLDENEYNSANRAHTVYKKNRGFGGIRVPVDTNNVKYRSQLIYDATIPADREKIWDNKAAWNKMNIATCIDMVDILLKAGEKSYVIEKLDEISGYDNDEDVIKN